MNQDRISEHPLLSNARVELYSEDFEFDIGDDIHFGYILGYHEIADWSNRAVFIDPRLKYSGKSYDHDSDARDYQLLIQPICKALRIYPPSFAEHIFPLYPTYSCV